MRRSDAPWLPCCRSALAALCALSSLAACGSDSPPTAGIDASVVLGTGESEFETMDGEPVITLVHGVQGGFHVWASFLAYGFEAQALDLTLTTQVEGASEDLVMHGHVTTREVLDADGQSARSFAGYPAQVRDARCVNGRRVELRLHLSDPLGHSADDVRHCVAEVSEQFRSDQCP
jgi:hypothetical protein